MASGAFLVLGILAMIEAHNLSLGDIHNPGPGFVPFFLGLSMTILSFLSFLSPDMKIAGDAFWNQWERGKSILYIFAGLIVYLLLLKTLGFYLNTFWLMIYLMSLAGEKGYRKKLMVSGLTIAVIYVVFSRLLIIPFPRGILGI